MIEFVCACKWAFIVGKKKVYGPIFTNSNINAASLMSYEEFADRYGDCEYKYQVRESNAI